jgi:hypothetical protein
MSDPVYAEDATVGTRYQVTMGDCCIEGHFTAVLTGKQYEPGPAGPSIGHIDGTPDLVALTFDNGVTLTDWLQAEFRAAPSAGEVAP